nr:MAG TPA: hypothetical protein [Caudoviricetes sp.]
MCKELYHQLLDLQVLPKVLHYLGHLYLLYHLCSSTIYILMDLVNLRLYDQNKFLYMLYLL